MLRSRVRAIFFTETVTFTPTQKSKLWFQGSVPSGWSMRFRWLVLLCVFVSGLPALGQGSAGQKAVTLNGTISDPSGARIPQANVEIRAAEDTPARQLVSDTSGRFSIALPAGSYEVLVSAEGFDPYLAKVRLSANTVNLDVKLLIAAKTVVEVNGTGGGASLSEDANGSALTISGDRLRNLSDDDATFQQQLQALAGGDGQHGGQVYVDGFSGGQIPPKSAIRAVKINQNPFSAEYDGLGFGRMEIFTKPGTGRLHGELNISGDPSSFNSRNPFLHQVEPSYYRLHTRGNLSGPIDKKTSFFVSADYYDQQNNAVINAQTVDANANLASLSLAVPDPETTTSYTARLDRQWTTNNTFTGRYEFDRDAQSNAGLSEYVLPSEAYNSAINTSTLQLGNTQIIGTHAELDTKFQWVRIRTTQNAVSNAPSILVQGTVSDGGSPTQTLHDHQDNLEFQENGTWEHKNHFLRVGGRYRLYRDANLSTAAYNGTFTFTDLASYQASVQGKPSASQFQLTEGQTNFSVLTGDLGLWVEDEWKFRKNMTADLGFRFETQSAIPDHIDPSPHLGLAWAVHQTDKKPPLVTLRAGAALFYDRFPVSALLTAVRQGNTSLQQTYTVKNPQFFATTAAQLQGILSQPGFSLGASTAPTIYRVTPDLRSEYAFNAGTSAEFSLGKHGSISFNYLLERGIHQWVSRNANAPLPDGSRPFGAAAGDQYEFASGGRSFNNYFFTNPQINITKKVQAWGFVNVMRANSDTAGVSSFTTNSYNIHQDYGRSMWDRRVQAFTGADADLKWGLHAGVFLAARGGRPFDITTGEDNNGDTIYNDRPAFASAASNAANVVRTAYGNFDTVPQPGERLVPINYGHSPRFISLQTRLEETVRFGPRTAEPGSDPLPPPAPGKPAPRPDPRYALVFSVEVQNLTNTVDPAAPIGQLTSPFFGHSIATANSFLSTSAANRTIQVNTTFRF